MTDPKPKSAERIAWKANATLGTLDADTGFSDYTLWADIVADANGKHSYGLSTFEVSPTWGEESTLEAAKRAAVSVWRKRLLAALARTTNTTEDSHD